MATTKVGVKEGGTGATTASTARTNLGVAIGSDVQAYDSDLTAWAGKTAPSGDVVGTTDAQTLSSKVVTAPDINGGTADSLTSLSVRSSGSGAFDLTIVNIEDLSAGKTLTLKLNNTSRTIDLGGNLTIANSFATVGDFSLVLTATAGTNVTLPTTGTLATLAGSETLSAKVLTAPDINAGTADSLTSLSIRDTSAAFDVTVAAVSSIALTAGRLLTIDVINAARTIKLGGSIDIAGSLTLANALITVGDNSLTLTTTGTTSVALPTTGTLATLDGAETFTSKTLTAPDINGGTVDSLTSLSVRSSGTGAFDLMLVNTENLTAGKTLTLTLNNTSRTIDLGGNLTLANALITVGNNSLTLTTTATTSVTLPTTGTLATLAGAETLSSKTLTAPKFADLGFLADANGNELLILDTVTSAVNEITLANGAIGANATLTASGETNAGITLTGKGTKGVTFGNAMLQKVSALSDGATPALDASLANVFTLSAGGDRTIAVPSNPVSGQKIIIAHTASGADRTLALNTGTGGFRFGTDVTSLTATTSGKTDYLGAIYNSADNKWDLIAVIKGF